MSEPSNIISFPRRNEFNNDTLLLVGTVKNAEEGRFHLHLARMLCRADQTNLSARAAQQEPESEVAVAMAIVMENFRRMRAAFAEAYAALDIAYDRLEQAGYTASVSA